MDKITKCVHGVILPLLANLSLNSLDHGVNDQPELNAKLVCVISVIDGPFSEITDGVGDVDWCFSR